MIDSLVKCVLDTEILKKKFRQEKHYLASNVQRPLPGVQAALASVCVSSQHCDDWQEPTITVSWLPNVLGASYAECVRHMTRLNVYSIAAINKINHACSCGISFDMR